MLSQITDFRNSKLFGAAPADIVHILSTEPVTSNFHQFCVTKEVKDIVSLNSEFKFKITIRSTELNGIRDRSGMESTV